MSLNVSTVQYSAIECIIEFGLRRGLTEVFLDRDLSAPTGVKTPADSTEKEKGGQKKRQRKAKPHLSNKWPGSTPISAPLSSGQTSCLISGGASGLSSCGCFYPHTHTHFKADVADVFCPKWNDSLIWVSLHLADLTLMSSFCQLSSFTAQKNTHICQQFF